MLMCVGVTAVNVAGQSSIAPGAKAPPCPAAQAIAQVASPFQSAEFAPADVRLLVQIENAAAIRKQLANRPIAEWAMSMFGQGEFRKAWSRLASSINVDQAQLFDQFLGRRATLIARGEAEWALITDVESSRAVKLLAQLKAVVGHAQHGMAMYSLPEQDLLIALDQNRAIVGCASNQALFRSVLLRTQGIKTESLAAQPFMARAAELGSGNVAVFTRHDLPLGGWSMIVADMRGSRVELKHAADFNSAPFTHGVTAISCDFSPVNAFQRDSLLAMIQPTDIGDGPVEAYFTATLREGLISKEMRANLGDRKILVVGEQEMRELKDPVDLLGTTFVNCIELKNKEKAVAQLDQHMLKLCEHVDRLCKGSMLTEAPDVARLPAGQCREVDLSPAAQWFTGGFPIMKNLSLTWKVVDSPDEGSTGGWYVIGTHRRTLDNVATILCKTGRSDAAMIGKFENCGVLNGQRISRHLQSWSAQAAMLAEEGQADALRRPLQAMSQLSAGITNCHWQLARPSANQLRLNIQIELAPAQSASE